MRCIIDKHIPANFHVEIAVPVLQIRVASPVELSELIFKILDGFKPERPQ
jgi:hypothetical protein